MAVTDHPDVEIDIHDLSGSGSGVGRLEDGRVVFVPRTAPGDRVRARLVQRKKSFARGILTARIEDAEDRRTAPCPLYDRCGGCQLQHLAYREQVSWKGRRIAETLRRVGGLDLDGVLGVEDDGSIAVEPAPDEFRYRNRVRMALRRLRGGRVIAGFHELDRPGRLVDVHDECMLPEPGIGEVWVRLREVWGPRASRLPDGEELQLTLRSAVDGVVLVIEGGSSRDRRGRADAAALVEEIEGLVAIWHRPGPSEVLEHLAGDRERTDRWFGETVPVGSKAFLQVNRRMGEAIHLDVLKELGNPAGLRVVDGYAGVGAYARRLARHGARVTGIELDPDAVEAARRGAPETLEVRQGRVEDVLPELDPPDRLILNPPRAGVDEAVTDWLTQHRVPVVVWISCDPATLARDLKRVGPGWELTRVRGYDLFPQTSHVETVVTMRPTDRSFPH